MKTGLTIFIGAAVLFLLIFSINRRESDHLKVAVASNFDRPAFAIAEKFTQQTGIDISLIPGSSGTHFAQIKNGAPYDLFLAADRERPKRLDEINAVVASTRKTYAFGKLVYWSILEETSTDLSLALSDPRLKHLAIANPKLAPYGAAAREVLDQVFGDTPPSFQIVRGENIAQTFHFVEVGSAQAGFVAESQHQQRLKEGKARGIFLEVPTSLHHPIEQQVVLVKDSRAGRLFLQFLSSPEASEIIRQFGYDIP